MIHTFLTAGCHHSSMLSASVRSALRPRELRRRVLLPARLRDGSRWADACILNLSSRGMLIHAPRAAQEGPYIELKRGDRIIRGRIVWRDGSRVGVEVEDRLPVEEIMSLDHSQQLQLAAMPIASVRKRGGGRRMEARLHGRAFEFAAAVVFATSMAIGAWVMAEQAFATPLAQVKAALNGQS